MGCDGKGREGGNEGMREKRKGSPMDRIIIIIIIIIIIMENGCDGKVREWGNERKEEGAVDRQWLTDGN